MHTSSSRTWARTFPSSSSACALSVTRDALTLLSSYIQVKEDTFLSHLFFCPTIYQKNNKPPKIPSKLSLSTSSNWILCPSSLRMRSCRALSLSSWCLVRLSTWSNRKNKLTSACDLKSKQWLGGLNVFTSFCRKLSISSSVCLDLLFSVSNRSDGENQDILNSIPEQKTKS